MNKKKVTAKLMVFGKKNRIYALIAVGLLAVYLFFYYIKCYFMKSKWRITSATMAFSFFLLSSSFAFTDVMNDVQEVVTDYEIKTEIEDSAEMELLEDKDVMDGYENAEIEFVEMEDRICVDEIIEEEEYSGNDSISENSIESESFIDYKNLESMPAIKNAWNLILINKQNPVSDDYEVPLGTIKTVKGYQQCDERIIPELLAMMQAAKDDGVNLVICSPYRDLNRQEVLFNRKVSAYMKKGMSYLEAYQISSQTVTVPGASEHQVGLAIDFVTKGYSYLNEGFADTDGGEWLAEHACEYGFILRYPKDKEYITGIGFEPWHFRYVGKEAAVSITEEGITLEEFSENL